MILLRCLRDPVNENNVRQAVHDTEQSYELFWASFTSDQDDAFSTLSQMGNSTRVRLIDRIDDGSIDIPSDKIGNFSQDRHKIAHNWKANTHVNTFDNLSNRSSILDLLESSYEIVDTLAKKIYGYSIEKIADNVGESIHMKTFSHGSNLSTEKARSLPIIQLISIYQQNLQLMNRYPMPFEAVINRDQHDLIEETISMYYKFDIDLAKNIDILPSIRRNQPIQHPSDFRVTDLQIPESCESGSEGQIQTEVALTDLSTDAHRDDDFKWYAILLIEDEFVRTYPQNPFKNMLDIEPIENYMPLSFSYVFDEEGVYTIEVIIVLEGTRSIQITKKERYY